MDGVDAVLARFADHSCEIMAANRQPYPDALRSKLLATAQNPEQFRLDTLGELDHRVADCFATATAGLLSACGIGRREVCAIGSHGQTVRHRPHASYPFTLQIGDPNIIAAQTGITTVADFRRRDLALGGEGAPLTPAFHQWLFSDSQRYTTVLNIGGIANVTLMPHGSAPTIGFDTGPGNTLLDAWIMENRSKAYDAAGVWAASGAVSQPLLQTLMNDRYFSDAPPKSTGFEYFNLGWLRKAMQSCQFPQLPLAEDVQATLAELTALSISNAVIAHAPQCEQVFVCGGGVHNTYLMSRLEENLQDTRVATTANCGLDPDWVEAAAFAWMAMRRLLEQPGNLPSVTGARRAAVLGGIFFGTV